MKKTTGELLASLHAKKNFVDFLRDEIDEIYFKPVDEYLSLLMAEKKLKKSDVIAKSNLDKNYAYQIFNGTKTNPSREKLIMLSFGMGLSSEETNKLLKIAGLCDLFIRRPRDSAIIFCLDRKKTLLEANEILSDLQLGILE